MLQYISVVVFLTQLLQVVYHYVIKKSGKNLQNYFKIQGKNGQNFSKSQGILFLNFCGNPVIRCYCLKNS